MCVCVCVCVMRVCVCHVAISRVSTHGCLKFTGQKTGVGAYTEKPFVRIMHIHANHRIIKIGGVGTYTEMGSYLGE